VVATVRSVWAQQVAAAEVSAFGGAAPLTSALGVMKAWVLAASVLYLIGCTHSRHDPAEDEAANMWAHMHPIPSRNERTILGEWELQNEQLQHCTLSIVSSADLSMLVQSCFVSTGCCNGSHGLALQKTSPTTFTEGVFGRTYEIQPDGSLAVKDTTSTTERHLPTPRADSLAAHWK